VYILCVFNFFYFSCLFTVYLCALSTIFIIIINNSTISYLKTYFCTAALNST